MHFPWSLALSKQWGKKKKYNRFRLFPKKLMLSRTKLLKVLLEQVNPSFWGKTCFVWHLTSNLLHMNRATLPFLILYQLLEGFLHKLSKTSHFTSESASEFIELSCPDTCFALLSGDQLGWWTSQEWKTDSAASLWCILATYRFLHTYKGK